MVTLEMDNEIEWRWLHMRTKMQQQQHKKEVVEKVEMFRVLGSPLKPLSQARSGHHAAEGRRKQ